jgi:ppGpp synthetase/RelA/SpoT-type nucleotidyltranferase
MSEPTLEEITSWKAQLQDPSFQSRLRAFQGKVFRVCDEHRRRVGMRIIRAVLPRHEVKSIESVVAKIARRRPKKPKYSFNDVEDLIGVKIFCPYLSSAETICDWLYNQTRHFHIKPNNKQDAYVYHEDRGYKGYHFTAEPNLEEDPAWFDLKCEIQVKTMCQETWDAFTHEISYKRHHGIDPSLIQHMKQLSNVLSAIDEQGEIIKIQIEQFELEEQERKDAAAIVYLMNSKDLLLELKERYDLKLSCEPPHELNPEDLSSLNVAISKYRNEVDVTAPLCYFVALIALCQKEPKQEDMAILLAKEHAERYSDDPRAEGVKASVHWALNRLDKSIEYGMSALKKAEETNTYLDLMKHQLCYWVAEASLSKIHMKAVSASLCGQAIKFGEMLYEKYPDRPGYLDTVGFLRIALGESIEEIEAGLALVREARSIGMKSENPYHKNLTEIFTRRHERIAFLRLAEKARTDIKVCYPELG